jgi:hypothetical protein
VVSVVRDLIEYKGIASCVPQSPTVFKEINVEEMLEIPEQKPDIEQLIKVEVNPRIKNIKLIRTVKGISMEGQKLTGLKIIVEGELKQRIQYVADVVEQNVHVTNKTVLFSTFIILPEDFCEDRIINVVPYIEDISALQIDKRKIYKNITILLDATQY